MLLDYDNLPSSSSNVIMLKKVQILPHTPWTASSFWAVESNSFSILIASLIIMGIGDGLLLLSNLGSAPWTILAQGVALQGGFSVGWASLAISLLVMLCWIPLKLKLGIGTILNVIVIAFFLGITVRFLPPPDYLLSRFAFALLGILLFGIGTALYLTCHQGTGPRDGLMVGLCQHYHWKIGIVRTAIEITACIFGFLLGGTLGIGTLMFALGIGWVVQGSLNIIEKYCH